MFTFALHLDETNRDFGCQRKVQKKLNTVSLVMQQYQVPDIIRGYKCGVQIFWSNIQTNILN